MTQVGFDGDVVRIWLEQLHGDSAGHLHICSTGNFAGATVDMSTSDWATRATYYVESLDKSGTQGIYVRATTLRDKLRPGQRERGGADHSLSLPGLWADIDLKGPGHKHEVCPDDCPKGHRHVTLDLPVTEEDARKIIAHSGLPDPTLWVHSGGGLYPWWFLDQPQHLTGSDVLEAAKVLSERWQRIIGAAAKELGFEYGTEVYDLSRVLRIPGTVNRKAGGQVMCRILENNSGIKYSIHELDETANRLFMALPEAPRHEIPAIPAPRATTPGSGTSPLDDFEARTDWYEILIPLGWQFDHQQGQTRYWVRPDKDRRDGHSATTGHEADRDRMYVFSTGIPELQAQVCHTKQYVYAAYHHAGSMSDAARALKDKGFGSPRMVTMDVEPVVLAPFMQVETQHVQPNGHQSTDQPVVPQQIQVPDLTMYEHSDLGNGERMRDMFGHKFRYVSDRKRWAAWDGTHWEFLHDTDRVKEAVGDMSKAMKRQAATQGEEGLKLLKWATTSGSDAKQNAAVAQLRVRRGVSVNSDVFDGDYRYLNIRNGILNLDTGELLNHDPKYMLSKTFGASYVPGAEAPRWRQFLEEVLPDEETRNFVQRMAGYSLLGKPNRRAMALLAGEPGTGKSKFVETLTHVFGDYGDTAAASLLRAKKGDNTSTVELHALRGKRFIATSEAAEDAKLDEELIKRLTGQDSVTSRGLYEMPQSWNPQAVIWMATNHKPKINPDDPAAWGRVKVVEFKQRFEGTDGQDHEILDKLLAEADGILNWLLEGLALFRADGVEAPQSVQDAGERYRTENDTALQFLEVSRSEEVLFESSGAELIKSHLYQRYQTWCERNKFPPLGQIKFNKRVKGTGVTEFKRGGQMYWSGLALGAESGFLGHMSG
jgi:putative DNA primase/helicase